jgi:membrane-bound serine protease (ClpP class)
MNAIILLFVLGILLLAAEVFTPGMVLGIIGGLSMLVGTILSFTQFGAVTGLVATGTAVVLLGVTVYLELYLLPRTRFGRTMLVQSCNNSTSQAPIGSDAIIGKSAEALTTLAPSGYVSVDGHRYEAFCLSGHAAKGDSLKVTSRDNFRLIVTHISS